MNIVDIGLIAGYILVILCTLAAVVIPLVQAMGDLKSLTKSAVGVGVMLVVFLISYAFSGGEAQGEYSEGTAKLVGAGLVSMYIFLFLALGGIAYSEISKMIK